MTARRRSSRWGSSATGLVVGMFVAGLLVPFVVGRDTIERVGAGGLVPGGTEQPAAEAGGETDGTSAPSGDQDATTESTVAAGGGSSAGGRPGLESRGASDVGITADSVRVGVIILGCGALADLCAQGGIDPDAQQRMWQALIDERNKAGGLEGRRIEPVYETFDALDTSLDSMRQVCVAMGEDNDVFGVLTWNFWGDPVLCLTQRYGLPFVFANGGSDAQFAASKGLLFSAVPGQARTIRNQIWQLHELGLLRGHTIGLLGLTGAGDEVGMDEAARPTLAEFGYEVAHESRITIDPSQRPAQTAVEVQAMKRAGVDVLIATHFDPQWTDEAERQNWRPTYLVSDFSGHSLDNEVQTTYDTDQFEGMVAVTATTSGDAASGVTPTAADRRCAATAAAGGVPPAGPRTAAFGVTSAICNIFTIFADGFTAAGVNPTRATFASATAGLRDLQLAGFPEGTGFPPGRTDIGSQVRAIRWSRDCGCYHPISDFVPVRY